MENEKIEEKIKVLGKIKYTTNASAAWRAIVGVEIMVKGETPEYIDHLKVATSDTRKYALSWHRINDNTVCYDQNFTKAFEDYEEAKKYIETEVKNMKQDIIEQLKHLKDMKAKELTIEKTIDPTDYL